MKSPLVLAIDGPSASGKGSLACRLAETFQLAHLDTGKLYRAVAYCMLKEGHSFEERDFAVRTARALTPRDMEVAELNTSSVALGASQVAAFEEVREALLDWQRTFAYTPPPSMQGTVLDGRDIGTVVCPDATVKFFVTADLEVRSQRRYKESLARGIKVAYEDLVQALRLRDARDVSRSFAPLKRASDAHMRDTSCMSADQVFTWAAAIVSSVVATRGQERL